MCEEAGSLRRSRSDPILVSLVASKARCTGKARVSLWPVEDPMWRSPRSRPLLHESVIAPRRLMLSTQPLCDQRNVPKGGRWVGR